MPTALDRTDDEKLLISMRRLRRAVFENRGFFALYPVESNLSPVQRDATLSAIAEFLEDSGMRLHRIVLSRDRWNLAERLEEQGAFGKSDAVVILGLEDTPFLVPAGGEEKRRPQALAVLNLQRESIERQLGCPTIIWCPPYAYRALMEHAPDFFDHYSSTFRFLTAAPAEPQEDEQNSVAQRSIGVEKQVRSVEMEATTWANIITPPSPALLAFYERQLKRELPDPIERAHTLYGLAEELYRYRSTEGVQRAIQLAEEAYVLYRATKQHHDLAKTLILLGQLIQVSSDGDLNYRNRRALAYYESALVTFRRDRFPVDWASTQVLLADTYGCIIYDPRNDVHTLSINYYESSLHVFTFEDYPKSWADVKKKMGITYLKKMSGIREENLKSSISCFTDALEVFKKQIYPRDWAEIQFNLGNVYMNISEGYRETNILHAINCYESSLTVYDQLKFPKEWSMVKNSLGNSYAALPNTSDSGNLQRAIQCYEEALTERTLENAPEEWALTELNLALAEHKNSLSRKALLRLHKILEALGNTSQEYHLDLVGTAIEQIQADLALGHS